MAGSAHPRDVAVGWPNVVSSDVRVEVARQIANRLRAATGDLSAREVGRRCGIDHSTVAAVIEGKTWPDLYTIARLEDGLGIELWPEHSPHGTNPDPG